MRSGAAWIFSELVSGMKAKRLSRGVLICEPAAPRLRFYRSPSLIALIGIGPIGTNGAADMTLQIKMVQMGKRLG